MRIDSFGIPVYNHNDIEQLMYSGAFDPEKIVVDSNTDIDQFNQQLEENTGLKLKIYQPINASKEDFDSVLQSDWHMPNEYKGMDIEEFLVNQCPKENYQRLIDELQEFRSRNMLDLLRWLKYFVDTCRKNNIVWGVGRGSSVASYVLYLIGVHKIDSIKYKLDWQEFLR
jgi:DNA polymerase III alpha subunit